MRVCVRVCACTRVLACTYAHPLCCGGKQFMSGGSGGVGHDHVCAIFAVSAPSNVCEFPIIGDRRISADIC